MESPKSETPKLPEMVMCGDHPSFTKTEPNIKEKPEESGKERALMSYNGILASSSRSDKGGERLERARAMSEHALRLTAARRRVRSLDAVPHSTVTAIGDNRALVHAALSSVRWPPYLVAVWVAALALTHALHAVVAALERTLPALRRFCCYFRAWTEETWKADSDLNRKLYPACLACITALLYALYYGLYVLYAAAAWSVEPLITDVGEDRRGIADTEAKVTDYVDDISVEAKDSIKQ